MNRNTSCQTELYIPVCLVSNTGFYMSACPFPGTHLSASIYHLLTLKSLSYSNYITSLIFHCHYCIKQLRLLPRKKDKFPLSRDVSNI